MSFSSPSPAQLPTLHPMSQPGSSLLVPSSAHPAELLTPPSLPAESPAPLPPALLQIALVHQHLSLHLPKSFVCNSQPFSRLLCSDGHRAVGVTVCQSPSVPEGAVGMGMGLGLASLGKMPLCAPDPPGNTCIGSLLVFTRVFVEYLGVSSRENQSSFLWLLAHPWAAGGCGAPTSLHFPPKIMWQEGFEIKVIQRNSAA